MSEPNNPWGVQVDDVWADADPRSAGRRLLVVEVGETHATVVPCNNVGTPIGTKPRQTKIRLDRFRDTSTGYRRVGGKL